MNRTPLENLEKILCKTINDICNVEDERNCSDTLVRLSRFLTSCSDKCIQLSRDYSYNDMLLETEKDFPYFKIPKYQWHDQIVSEIKIPILNNDIPIINYSSEDIPSSKPSLFKVATYKPTKMKEFNQYQYKFDRLE